ncbi:MAG: Uma2 family endonuclease [Thermoguttaceae bacterium]
MLRASDLHGAPVLAIEIVSPDSEARDWREKDLEYESGGVREYGVIDPMSRHVEPDGLESPPAAKAPARPAGS